MPTTEAAPPPHSHFSDPFVETLTATSNLAVQDDPNYYAEEPKSLISKSTVHSFANGTGSSVYQSLAPLLESTNYELILVTCFWARSETLDSLNEILRKLSEKAIHRGTVKIKVQLCFSSSSLFQQLFHKQSTVGQEYPPTTWVKKLGLPAKSELGGLDLQVNSIFILPFSVMHPKFMIIDRQTVILPSCNISWEEWFEGAITFSGPVVDQFLKFHNMFWQRNKILSLQEEVGDEPLWQASASGTTDQGHANIITHFSSLIKQSPISAIPTIFLPSPHRRNPKFRPFASSDSIVAPPTPLNTFVLTLFGKAEKSIRIQSPNITSPPVLSALLKALTRGINVTILTSSRLMILEQLVTAGTTTSRCIKTLIKRYKRLTSLSSSKRSLNDEEAALSETRPGNLRVSFFEPLNGSKQRGEEAGEPQQSHLKMTIVDDGVLVLGSGNLDRASWFTSQELGVAFFDRGLVDAVAGSVDAAMEGRTRLVFDSDMVA